MVEIWVEAEQAAPGSKVVAYWFSEDRPTGKCGNMVAGGGVTLSRVYKGYGQLRAETGPAPRRGFGNAICNDAYIRIPSKTKLWLKVED